MERQLKLVRSTSYPWVLKTNIFPQELLAHQLTIFLEWKELRVPRDQDSESLLLKKLRIISRIFKLSSTHTHLVKWSLVQLGNGVL
jgi:hypothetical protein